MEKLRLKCEYLIKKYENDMQRLEKLNIIKEILNDNYAFFKIDMETSLSILKDLEYTPEESLNIYSDLISADNYLKYKNENID